MPKSNKICYTCGNGYYFCPSCPSKGKTESYYNMFCSERCSQIFKTLTDETFKHITTEECKEKLQKLNVSKKETFKESVNKHIERVFAVKEKGSEELIIKNEKDESNEISVTDVENIEAIKMIAPPRKSRKKKNSEVDFNK